MDKILIVDDEVEIAELISDILKSVGYNTTIKNNAEDALMEINNDNFDLIILDVMLPKMSGTSLCALIRDKINCPIIFVSAKTQTVDKLVGFEIGADDYITKPFINAELVARVKANIRQNMRNKVNQLDNNIIKIGDIEINKNSYEVKKNNDIIELSTKEFDLLYYLMDNAGIVLSKEQIYNAVWGSTYGDIGTVAVHIKNLRSKIDVNDEYIITIWGVGYKFAKELL